MCTYLLSCRENSVPDGSIGRDRSGVDTTNTGDHDTNSDNASAAEYLGETLSGGLKCQHFHPRSPMGEEVC